MNVSGTIQLVVNMKDNLPAGATRVSGYSVPFQETATTTYATGTAANQAQKSYQTGGTTTVSTPVPIDLTATANSDGTTGFSNVRELLIGNLSSTDGQDLKIGGGSNPFAPFLGGTSPTLTIKAGTWMRLSNPLNATGWAVGSGAKVVQIDPGSNAIPWAMIVFGS